MNFKDISNKELRELNLYPINKFKNFKIRCDTGYYDVYRQRDNHERILRYPRYFGSYGLEYVPHWDDYVFVERIEMKDFLDMCQNDFEFWGFKGKSLDKMLWLQKYLKGEIDGVYSDSNFNNNNEIKQRDETIAKLRSKLSIAKDENETLKQKIKELENELSNIHDTKSKLLEFINQIQETLNDSSQKLQ